MTPSELAMSIKCAVDARTVAEHYGFRPNRAGFICCPFHDERTPSLKLFDGNRGFYCFGCGENGSVIDFVEKLFDLSFIAACLKIDLDFNLKLPIDRKPSFREKKCARNAEIARKNARAMRDAAERQYWDAVGDYVCAEREYVACAPSHSESEWIDEWVMAAKMRTVAFNRMEEAEIIWQRTLQA
jgi:hypothetical protein